MNYKTLTLVLLLGLATHTSLQAAEVMHHEGHDMSQMEGEGMEGMNHEGHDMSQMDGMPHESKQNGDVTEMAQGEVRKIDANKVTIKHGPLNALSMPAMTMTFNVSDPSLIEGLKEGDKVRFTPIKQDGSLLVTAIQKS